eukprot:1716390-Rhodomonas_salina.1
MILKSPSCKSSPRITGKTLRSGILDDDVVTRVLRMVLCEDRWRGEVFLSMVIMMMILMVLCGEVVCGDR